VGEPEQNRVELHQLRERAPGPFVGEDLGHQVHAEPGRTVLLVGGEDHLVRSFEVFGNLEYPWPASDRM